MFGDWEIDSLRLYDYVLPAPIIAQLAGDAGENCAVCRLSMTLNTQSVLPGAVQPCSTRTVPAYPPNIVSTCDEDPVLTWVDYDAMGVVITANTAGCPSTITRVWAVRDFCNASVVLNQSITTSPYTVGAGSCAAIQPQAVAFGLGGALLVNNPCLVYGLSVQELLASQPLCHFAPSAAVSPAILFLAPNATSFSPMDAKYLTQGVQFMCNIPPLLPVGVYSVELSLDGGRTFVVEPHL